MNLKFWETKKETKPQNNNDTVEFADSISASISELTKTKTRYKEYEYWLSQYQQYNPNPLVLKKTMNIFDEMYIKDEQIKACYNIKRRMILSNGFNVVCDDMGDKKQKEIKDFIWWALNDGYSGLFFNDLFQVLTAIQFGFSISEKVFSYIKKGIYADKIGINIVIRPPHSFEFYLDTRGNILKIVQSTEDGYIEIYEKDIIIYTFDKQFSNPFGLSDFTQCYQAYFSKLILKKYMNIYAEKFAINPIIGKYPVGASKEIRDNLQMMVSKIQASSAGIIPANALIETLNTSKGDSGDFFKNCFDEFNRQIARAFLLPELLGFSEHTTGSQALGEEQFDLFMNTVVYPEQSLIEDLINEKLIKELVILNFGEQENYPKFIFNKPEAKNKLEMLKVWIDAVNKGVVKSTIEDENIIRNEFGFEDREEEQIDEIEPNIEPTEEPIIEQKKEFKEAIDNIKFRRKPTEFEEKISLNTIKSDIEIQEKSMALNLSNVVSSIKIQLQKDIKDKKIIQKKRFNYVNNLEIDKNLSNKMLKVFRQSLNETYKKAKDIAKSDLPKKEFADIQYTIGAIEPSQSIQYLEAKAISLKGTEDEFILKGVKNILNDGLKTGKTESQIMSNLEDFFTQYRVGQLNNKGEIVDINQIGGRLTTIIRTNLNDAYNQGRMALYNDPAIKGFVKAFQYSAIMDDFTTDFCRSMDGKIYAASDAIWDTITPPNHFNCRSILIAIFEDENYTISDKISAQPAKNFGGNL